MANVVNHSAGNVDVSLDGTTDFDWTTDLPKAAPAGGKVKAIRWDPSAADDEVIVRDGANGPRIFKGGPALGDYDKEIEYYRGDERPDHGKPVSPYIHANECTVASPNDAYVYFDLGG